MQHGSFFLFFFFQFSTHKTSCAQKTSITENSSRFNLHQNYHFRNQDVPRNALRFVPNFFEPDIVHVNIFSAHIYQHYFTKNSMLFKPRIQHATWIFLLLFFQFSTQKTSCTQKTSITQNSSKFNLHQNYHFRNQDVPRNALQFVPNCFKPTPMLGLSSMAMEWPLDKGIPSRRRTLPLEA